MTLWKAPERSPEVQDVYQAAEDDRRSNPDRYTLDPAQLAERADRDGTATFADGWWDGLVAYLASAEADGRLNALGRRSVAGTAIARLRAGAALDRHLAEYPEVLERTVPPPIVITGGWRTGTTFLFRLLASDPRLRAPLPSELASPTKIASLAGPERQRMVDASASAHDTLHFLNPELQAIHDSGPELPEECVLAIGQDMRNWGFTSTVRLDSYAGWLAAQDLGPAYRRYADVIRTLDCGDGRRWVLKAPAHLAELSHLAAAFPGAVLVHLHRDIVETIASGSSLFAVFRSMYSDEVDPVQLGAYQADQTELWLRRAEAFRRGPEGGALTWVDLGFTELVTDPVAAIAAVYQAADMAPPADPQGFVADYHAAHPRHEHGKHRYSAAEFGLDENELRERFADVVPQ